MIVLLRVSFVIFIMALLSAHQCARSRRGAPLDEPLARSEHSVLTCPVSKCSNKIWANCSTSSNVTCSAGHVCFNDRCVSSSNFTGLSCNATSRNGNVCTPFSAMEVAQGRPPVICYIGMCQAMAFPNEKCDKELNCFGKATCVNGTCRGVMPPQKCTALPYDDCDPSSYCATNGTCTLYSSVGKNCSMAKCTPGSYCASVKGPSNSTVIKECALKWVAGVGSSCQANEACEYGLICYNHTCMEPVGVGSACNFSDLGNRCNGTIPETMCMCDASSPTPLCMPPAYEPAFLEACATSVARAFTCMEEHHCYMPQFGDLPYLGTCFHSSNCSASEIEDCLCDLTDSFPPGNAKACNSFKFCHSSSSKWPLWLLLVVIFASCCGGCCVICCGISIGCTVLNCFLQLCTRIAISGGNTGYEYIN